MYKLPKPIIVFIFFLLCALQFFFMILIKLIYLKGILKMTEIEYYIVFGIISIVAIFLGMFFVNMFRAWTVEELASRMDNIIEINNAIIRLQQRKAEIDCGKIKDTIKVLITPHEIKGEKK